MATIDERVVSMSFENAKFEAGVAQTMATLSKLDASLKTIGTTNSIGDIEKAASKVTLQQPLSALDKLKARLFGAGDGAAQGLSEIDKAGNKVTLEGPGRALDSLQSKMGQLSAGTTFTDIEKASATVTLGPLNSAVDSVSAKFSAMTVVATSALSTITMDATRKGAAFSKGFVFGPIKQGFQEYATNLNSIQTILANTLDSGGNLKTVNAALNELNTYSDKTIYNFSEMARNIGTFTAAGVRLKPATAAIKGIANLAALSGSNSQQASTAMYQLSQAIAAGKVGLQDWNSVVNAGMGGAVFQKSLMRTAENMGALEKGAVKVDKATGKATVNGESFRNSIMAKPGQESWLTSDVLTKTLSQFTGDMTDAQLASQGFNAEQIKAIQLQAKTAQNAATQVKTIGQVFDVAKETIGSGWSKTFQTIFGDFGESKKTFTEMSNSINGFINKLSNARNKILGDWKELGGRTDLIAGIKNAFHDLFAILKPIQDAFREIFPAKTGKDLFEMTKNFKDLTERLKPSPTLVEGIKRTFAGFFAVLHIGWSIIKGVVGVIGDLLGVVGHGSGGFLSFTGSIGDFLVAVDKALTKGGLLKGFFNTLSSILQVPMKLLTGIASAVFGIFGGFDAPKADKMSKSLDGVRVSVSPLKNALDSLKGAWDGFVHILSQAKDLVSPWLDTIGTQLSHLGDIIHNALSGDNFDKTMATLQTAFIGGIFLALKKAISGGASDFTKTIGGFKNVLGGLSGTLQAMQQNIKANTILQIATAIGLLAASTYVLSKIDPSGLSRAMTAIAVGLGQLVGALAILSKIGKGGGFLTMPILAGSLILLAGSLVILAAAMKIFATMSWEELGKGLLGVAGGLTAIGIGMKFLGPGTIIQAPAILILAVALNALALAVKQFASMNWKDMARGLAGVFGSLVALIAPITAFGPGLLLTGPGLIAVAFAMNMLAAAVMAFGQMDLKTLGTGLLGVSTAIVAIGLGIGMIPPTVALQAAGLVILAVALTGIAEAVKMFGSIGIVGLVKGLTAMGASLLILAVGLTAMTGTLAGSAALLVAATGLALLAPTLGFLGTLKWGTIFKGLAAIGLALGTLAIAGLLAAPGLSSLGVALLPLAGVFVLTAGAMYLFAKALSLLAGEGGKGIAVLVTAITTFITILPNLVINFVKGLLEIVQSMYELAPKIVDALGKVLDIVIGFVLANAGRFAVAVGTLVDAIIKVLVDNIPKIVEAGAQLLLGLLKGIDNHVVEIVSRGASIVLKFLGELANHAEALVAAGANLVIKFLTGITNQLPRIITSVATLVATFVGNIAARAGRIVAAGASLVVNLITGIANKIPDVIGAGVHFLIKFLDGIGQNIGKVERKAVWLVGKFLDAMANAVITLSDKIGTTVVRIIHGIDQAVNEHEREIINAGAQLALDIISGFVSGISDLPGLAWKKVKGGLHGFVGKVKGVFKSHSPSQVFIQIGQDIVAGLGIGLGGIDGTLYGQGIAPLAKLLRENKDVGTFGKFLGKEFQDGLTGGLFASGKSQAQTQIESTFAGLRAKFTEEQNKLRDNIKSDQSKLDQLLGAKKQDRTAIAKVMGDISADKQLLDKSKAASAQLMKSLGDEKYALVGLAKEYETVSAALDQARTALDEATRTRDDALKSYKDQYDNLPDIGEKSSTQVQDYKKALQDQIIATQKYMETLKKLRAAGLDDQTYQMLLAKGTAGQDFASGLLSQGSAGIAQINALDEKLANAAAELAKNAATSLYQAGVDAAQGLVDSLKAKQSEIRGVMEDIAKAMVKALKKELGIKSPSRVFAELGKFSVKGLADGLTASSGMVTAAAQSIGDDAANALTNSLANISDQIQSNIDTDLTITPVLDLTQVQKDASKMQDLTNVTPITAAASYGQASAISQEQQASQAAATDTPAATGDVIKFEQNNYSPEALSATEVYRQTRNQLSQAKRVLGIPTLDR